MPSTNYSHAHSLLPSCSPPPFSLTLCCSLSTRSPASSPPCHSLCCAIRPTTPCPPRPLRTVRTRCTYRALSTSSDWPSIYASPSHPPFQPATAELLRVTPAFTTHQPQPQPRSSHAPDVLSLYPTPRGGRPTAKRVRPRPRPRIAAPSAEAVLSSSRTAIDPVCHRPTSETRRSPCMRDSSVSHQCTLAPPREAVGDRDHAFLDASGRACWGVPSDLRLVTPAHG